jgi:hypothetical protein
MLKSYKYKIKPNEDQIILLEDYKWLREINSQSLQ